MRIGVISDVHANMIALDTVMTDMESQNLDLIVNLGDVVGRGNRNNDAAQAVKALAHHSILGNHDRGIRCYPEYSSSTFLSSEIISWLDGMLTEEAYRKSISAAAGEITFMHSVMDGDGRFLYIGNAESMLDHSLPDSRLVFMGHEHVERAFCVDKANRSVTRLVAQSNRGMRRIYNMPESGQGVFIMPSVGNPRDYPRLTGYGIIDDSDRTVTVRRLPYDTGLLARQMRDEGYRMGMIAEFFMHDRAPLSFNRFERLHYAFASYISKKLHVLI